MDLRKIFHPPEADTEVEYGSSELESNIRAEYRSQVLDQLARFGITPEVVSVDMRAAGFIEGRAVFLAMLKLVAWERKQGVRLLLGLPLLEIHVRRAIQGTWLVEASHFGGLWLHPSSVLQRGGAAADVQQLLIQIEGSGADSSDPIPSGGDEQHWRSWPAGATDLSPLDGESKP